MECWKKLGHRVCGWRARQEWVTERQKELHFKVTNARLSHG